MPKPPPIPLPCAGYPSYEDRATAAWQANRRRIDVGGCWTVMPCGYADHFHVGRESRANRANRSKRARVGA